MEILTDSKKEKLREMIGAPIEISPIDEETYGTMRHYKLAREFAKYGIRLYIGRAYKKDKNRWGIRKKIYNDKGMSLSALGLKELEEYLRYIKSIKGGI